MDAPTRLKEWRQREGITQEEAALRINVSQNAWSEWERGKKRPRIETALELAVITGGACPIEAWANDEAA